MKKYTHNGKPVEIVGEHNGKSLILNGRDYYAAALEDLVEIPVESREWDVIVSTKGNSSFKEGIVVGEHHKYDRPPEKGDSWKVVRVREILTTLPPTLPEDNGIPIPEGWPSLPEAPDGKKWVGRGFAYRRSNMIYGLAKKDDWYWTYDGTSGNTIGINHYFYIELIDK